MKHLLHGTALSETMGLTLVLWLCSLLLVGLVVLPLFGRQVALGTALGLLVALLAVCWGMCSHRSWGNGGQL